jgi:tetratricopeptide (TPR) repeat protein/mono/diheme cytochrome c family protein
MLAGAAAITLLARPANAQVTYTRDVAPILFRHCASCHSVGGPGPFSVLAYGDVRRRATQIADVTRNRVMPPRKAEPADNEFVGQERLSDTEIATIAQWADQGAVEGDPSQLPPVPRANDGWQLGQPDLIVRPPAYTLQTEGADIFRIFVIPLPVGERRYVRGLEFRPGNRVVHHANIRIDRTPASRRFDENDPAPGYDGLIARSAGYLDGHFLGWTPGQAAPLLPKGLAWDLDPGSDLVVELHMQPSGKTEIVQASIGFFFGCDPPERTPLMLRLGRQNLDIPPGEPRFTSTDSFVLPVDVEVQAVQPHAHYLAREVRGTARLTDGTVRPLIYIKDWDFRWQQVYRYAKPFPLPKGTTLSMEIVYDNSAANPRNPSRPPRRVGWGQRSADEMGDLWLQVIPVRSSDLAILSEDFERKKRAEDLAGYTKVLHGDPLNPLRHDAVAMLRLEAGQIDQAVVHFRDSLRLNPNSAPTHYNLGIALSIQRRLDEALAEFREAVRLDANYAEAHNNLGAMLHLGGRLDEATAHYRRAVELRADNAEARSNLGRILTMTGHDAAAVDEFRKPLELRPDLPYALAGLSWVLATSADASLRRPDEAVHAGERAAALTQNADPSVLDTLAAAYASVGDFDRAISTARNALAVATRLGMTTLAEQVRGRLTLFERRQPYWR